MVSILEIEFKEKNADYHEILRFLLKQEINNCYRSEIFTSSLAILYDGLAYLKFNEDIPLLLAAIDETSFDANCALSKDRLFFNGYENVINYLESNKEFDINVLESIKYYAEYLGYEVNDS